MKLHIRNLAKQPFLRHGGVAVVVLVASALAGCSGQTDANVQDSRKNVAPNRIVLPVVNKTEDEIRIEMAQYPAFSPEFNKAMLEFVIVKDKIKQREGVEGFIKETPIQHAGNQSAVVDEKTGKIALRAMTCFNPECTGKGKGGGPLLFVYELPNISLGSDGKMVVGPFPMAQLDENPLVCPVCGEAAFVRPYDPPETMVRRQQLMEQLDTTRGSRGKGKRTVKEIILEMANLPKLFLVPQE